MKLFKKFKKGGFLIHEAEEHQMDQLRSASEILEEYNLSVIQASHGMFFDSPIGVVQFHGFETDLFRAYEVLTAFGYIVGKCSRVHAKQDNIHDKEGNLLGETWTRPVNEVMIFFSC